MIQSGLAYAGGTASSTRGLTVGGRTSGPTTVNTIEYMTIATTGSVADFGDLTQVKLGLSAVSNTHGGIG